MLASNHKTSEIHGLEESPSKHFFCLLWFSAFLCVSSTFYCLFASPFLSSLFPELFKLIYSLNSTHQISRAVKKRRHANELNDRNQSSIAVSKYLQATCGGLFENACLILLCLLHCGGPILLFPIMQPTSVR